jgi:osmotically-inducible protein OsmY
LIRSLPLPLTLPIAAVLAAFLSAPSLTGCAPAVVVGTTYGAAVVYDRRDEKTVLDDEWIELRAREIYLRDREFRLGGQFSVTSYNYAALITGRADTEAVRERYAQRISELPKVRRVYNEVAVGPGLSLSRIAQDSYLTSRAKLAIQAIDLPNFDALRVKVVTDDAVVYLMGLVSPEEGDATAERVRRIPGVARVVKIFEYVEPKTKGT